MPVRLRPISLGSAHGCSINISASPFHSNSARTPLARGDVSGRSGRARATTNAIVFSAHLFPAA